MHIPRRKDNWCVLYCVIALFSVLIYTVFWKAGYLDFVNISDVKRILQTGGIFHTSRRNSPYTSRLNFTWIENHPVYKKFQVREAKEKNVVSVLVIVPSAPNRVSRRSAIRITWWRQCVKTDEVTPACIFMTDYQSIGDSYYLPLQLEQSKYEDIYFQKVEDGVAFGLRFINHMILAVQKYNFDYFLRLDDDQLFCMEKFLQELPLPMMYMFHWGWVHLQAEIERPEESIILLSRDVVEQFLMQDVSKMLCHPWADQMIAIWLKSLNVRDLLRHDSRICHTVNLQGKTLDTLTDICHSCISIHGVYPRDMHLLWADRGSSIKPNGNLATNSRPFVIDIPFNWKKFQEIWVHEPKLCASNPNWNTSKKLTESPTSYARWT